jgi:phosphatidylcholine synthase
LAGLSFVPVRFVHPIRVRRLRVLNLAVLALWAALALAALAAALAPPLWVSAALCAVALYFLAIGAAAGRA